MFDSLVKTATEVWVRVKHSWADMSALQRGYAFTGLGVVILGFMVGGPLMQAVFTGLIFNTLLWMMFWESQFIMGVMRAYGGKIDLVVTLLGFLFGGGGGVTALMVGVVVGALFSVFRVLICGPQKKKAAKENRHA